MTSSGPQRLCERLGGPERSARFEQLRGRLPRYLFTGLVVILSLAGLRVIVAPAEAPAPPAPEANVDQAAEQLALRFARAYLSYNTARPGPREGRLAQMIASDMDSDAGFIPARGARTVTLSEVAQNQEALAGGRIIVVYAETDTQETFYLAVPVERVGEGAMSITDYPSLVGPPQIAQRAITDRAEVEDEDIVEVVRRGLGNYLALEDRNLRADLAPEAEISMPPTAMRMGSLEGVVWADGPDGGAVLITANARAADRSTYTLTYELGLERRGGRVLISFIEVIPTTT